MIRSAGIARLAATGAATAMLWLSPAAAGEQSMPGATVEGVVAIQTPQSFGGGCGARLRCGGQIADACFGVDTLRNAGQIYAVRQLPPVRPSVENRRNGFRVGSSDVSLVFESECRPRAIHLDLLKPKVELQMKYAEMERLAGGSL